MKWNGQWRITSCFSLRASGCNVSATIQPTVELDELLTSFFWVFLLEGSFLMAQVLDSEAKIMAADLVSPWVQDCFMGPRQAKPVTTWHGKDTCQSSLLAFWARPCHWALTFENIWHSWRVTVSYARQDYIVWYILCLPMCSVENRLHWKGEG